MRYVTQLVIVATALLVSIPAGAVPVVYGLTAGTITVGSVATSVVAAGPLPASCATTPKRARFARPRWG